MFGTRSHTTDGQEYRPVFGEKPAAITPDTYEDALLKFRLFEIRQRARNAGIATCMLEVAS